jgi:alpha-N-dichloroacetyl-p-aminophenylserinol N-oxygenase
MPFRTQPDQKQRPDQESRHGQELPFERDLLLRLTRRWGKRVAVKQDELDLDGHFDPALPDFPAQAVPVLQLPAATGLDPAARQQVLSAAWIAYNDKTSAVENEVILPACRLMLMEHVPGRKDDAAITALHQTVIDEHYHILMGNNAAGVTRRRRGLPDLGFDPRSWSVVRGLDRYRSGLTGTAREIAEIAFGLAAETTINLLFENLAADRSIQPMNRMTVDLHRRDESGHSAIFRQLAGPFFRALSPEERDLFTDALLQGLLDFRAPDHEAWATVGRSGGLDVSASQLAEASAGARRPPRDTGPLRSLLADLGLTQTLGPALDKAAAG